MAAFSGGKFADVFGKVTIVNKLPLLLKATSDDERPIPGYMYPEISALTYEKSHQQQGAAVLSFLLDRLGKRSWHVKLKALQIMKYVTTHGEGSFRNSLRRQTEAIQEATKYNTTPDPLHGSAPILAVRKAATELLEVLFNESLSMTSESTTSSSCKMEGFGNVQTMTQQKTVASTLKDNLQQLGNATTIPSSQDTNYRSLKGVPECRTDHQGIQRWSSTSREEGVKSSGSYQPVHVEHDDMTQKGINKSVVSQMPGDQTRSDDQRNGEGFLDRSQLTVKTSSSSEVHSGGSLDLSQRLEAVAVADWSQEEQLVNEMVASSVRHLNSVPSREDINSFAKRASSLNSEKIVEILVTKMKSSTEAQVGCLCGIEAITREGLVPGECVLPIIEDVLPSLQQSSNSTVRAKASKIQRQLKPFDDHIKAPVTASPSQTFKSFDILENTASVESPLKIKLFDGMSVKTKHQKNDEIVVEPGQSLEVDGNLISSEAEVSNQELHNVCKSGSRNTGQLEAEGIDLLCFDGSRDEINHESTKKMDNLIMDNSSSKPITQLAGASGQPSNVKLKEAAHIGENGTKSSSSKMDDQLSDFLRSFRSTDSATAGVKTPMKQRANTTDELQLDSRTLSTDQGAIVNVSEMHPQLIGAKMSSQSTVPLQLHKSNGGQFDFISSSSGAGNKNSFAFVQEAMKVNRR